MRKPKEIVIGLQKLPKNIFGSDRRFNQTRCKPWSTRHKISLKTNREGFLRYISFNTTMTQLQLTLSRCAADIAGFSVMFMIIFIAYAQFGYLVFGQTVYNFSAFPESLFTLFRIILGDFDFHELEQANYILGPIFFITYVFLVFFVLLNMFLAIINDTYSVVKEELSMKESEFQLSDYIKKGYNKVLKKLHLKREHIKNIQDALNTADVNADKVLDWDEWRNDLRMRGIPDNEIEAVFAKYDTDGDMVLNEAEQKQLLEGNFGGLLLAWFWEAMPRLAPKIQPPLLIRRPAQIPKRSRRQDGTNREQRQ